MKYGKFIIHAVVGLGFSSSYYCKIEEFMFVSDILSVLFTFSDTFGLWFSRQKLCSPILTWQQNHCGNFSSLRFWFTCSKEGPRKLYPEQASYMVISQCTGIPQPAFGNPGHTATLSAQFHLLHVLSLSQKRSASRTFNCYSKWEINMIFQTW